MISIIERKPAEELAYHAGQLSPHVYWMTQLVRSNAPVEAIDTVCDLVERKEVNHAGT